MTRSLGQWLAYQEQLHPADIDLTLDRVHEVGARLQVLTPSVPVITVGGTNGKGTTVQALERILLQSGSRVGSYTSPHLHRYNERVRIDAQPVDDDELCAAFEAVENARGDVPLTYFEFGTLAALYVLGRHNLDICVLEVGLGGRFDAVNAVDADVAVITSIDLDHCDWLGDTRDSVALEKIGISREGRPLVVGERDRPQALDQAIAQRRGDTYCIGRDFDVHAMAEGDWRFEPPGWTVAPRAGLIPENIACALQALDAVGLAPDLAAFTAAVDGLAVPGRCQVIEDEGIEWILDVAHNPAAIGHLAAFVAERPAADETIAICGMLSDKIVDDVMQPLCDAVDMWHLVDLPGARGATAFQLARRLPPISPYRVYGGVGDAIDSVRRGRAPGRRLRVIVFGSFVTVGLAQI